MKKTALIIMVISNLMTSCKEQNNENQNVEILDVIWGTMNTEYFDSTFGGLDWQKEYENYKPIIEACE